MKKFSEIFQQITRFQKFGKIAFRIIVIFFMIFSFLYIILFIFFERIQSFAYFPGAYMKNIGQDEHYNLALPDDWEKISFEIGGKQVFGIYIGNDAKETIYFFHGSGGDLRYFQEAINIYLSWGYNVLALEYPGYGGLEGYPTAENIMESAHKLYELARVKYTLSDETTFIWGYSTGTGIAASFVREGNFPVLVLESPYTSWYDLASDKIGFVPQRYLGVKNIFNTEKNLLSYKGKVLVVHGEKDEVVPVLHTYRIQEAVEEKLVALIDPVGDHYNLLDNHETLSKIEYFLENKDFDETQYQVEEKRKDFLEGSNYDIYTDSSTMKYVDPDVSFIDVKYVPNDMRKLNLEYIIDGKGDLQLRDEAAMNFENMAQAFYKYFGEKILTVSSYRSYLYQAGIKSRGCPDNLCAKAGHSEHQSGLAIDLWSASSVGEWQKSKKLQNYYNWLGRNAHFYGWHNPYRKGLNIDGYEKEPWHWRYLGVDLASYLHEQDITFAEYFKARKRFASQD